MKKSLTAIMLVALITPVPTVAAFGDDDDEVVEEVVVTADRESAWLRVGGLYADYMWHEHQMREAERQAAEDAARALADAAAEACESAQQEALAVGAMIGMTVVGTRACGHLLHPGLQAACATAVLVAVAACSGNLPPTN